MISMSRRAAKGVRCETRRVEVLFLEAGMWSAGRRSANWVKPKAVRTAMMFVSWEKSKLRDWFRGKVSVLLSRVTFICATGEDMTWCWRRARISST